MAPGDEGPLESEAVGENLCRDCGGSGRKGEEPCEACAGTGVVGEGIGGA
jgi:DnaJ-class molecular chaperone